MIEVVDGRPQGPPELVKADIGPVDRTIGLTRNVSLYYSLNTGMEDVFIAELDPVTGRVTGQPSRIVGRYVGSNMGPVWSPDGKYLAYHSQRGPRRNAPGALVIVVRSMETGEEREIPTRLAQCGPVHWFPDGLALLAQAYPDAKRDRIDYYRIDIRSGEASLIRRSEGGYESQRPDLSPDGKTIFFTHTERDSSGGRRRSLMAYEIETQQDTEIYRVGEGKPFASNVLVSPDGRQLAFIARGDDPNWAVIVMPAEGGSPRELLRVQQPDFLRPNGLTWMPDGHHLLVSKFNGPSGPITELLRVPVEGGDAQKLGLAMERIEFGDVHPDGQRIAFSSGQRKDSVREVWVMENFLPESGAQTQGN